MLLLGEETDKEYIIIIGNFYIKTCTELAAFVLVVTAA